ncbi:MAG TPA: alpha/beta hydrolase [Mycobacterium sp.]|uniref:alpha/beta fold hydrolase n=1 Tax=Mycobacterium sp. TaxID=1785 RepID=UPI002D56FD47|nr:alpha/beta hydrolase [Mycobacterium sp.]HXY66907.1 alpha/beta hydrolase [Mycobacterium sp.]
MRLSNPWRHPFRVPRIEKPRAEGRFHLAGGRRLGYAEYGDPAGPVVLWFHGTPGGRRQFPLLGRRTAEKLGLRVVVVERPGSGLSDPHRYNAVADWAADAAQVADTLDAERLGVIGLSGGGPYALSCAGTPALAGRVAAVAILGSVTPTIGPDATATGLVDLTRRFAPILSGLRQPLAAVVAAGLLPVVPLGHWAYQGFASVMPEADRQVFADSEIEAMFIDDIALTARGRFQALVDDLRLFGRNWGFRLADVKAPVRWWQGDADPIVSVEEVKSAVSYLSDVELILRPGKSHLGGFADVDEILGFISSSLRADLPTRSIQ